MPFFNDTIQLYRGTHSFSRSCYRNVDTYMELGRVCISTLDGRTDLECTRFRERMFWNDYFAKDSQYN